MFNAISSIIILAMRYNFKANNCELIVFFFRFRFTHHLPLFSVEKSHDTHETTHLKTIENQNEEQNKREQITI